MTVTLTPEMQALVNERLTRGLFASPEEVIVAALHLLRQHDAGKEVELRALLDEAEADVAAGRVAPFDPVATAARVKAAIAARAEGRS